MQRKIEVGLSVGGWVGRWLLQAPMSTDVEIERERASERERQRDRERARARARQRGCESESESESQRHACAPVELMLCCATSPLMMTRLPSSGASWICSASGCVCGCVVAACTTAWQCLHAASKQEQHVKVPYRSDGRDLC